MTQTTGTAVAALVVGLVLAAIVAMRIRSGISFNLGPLARVSRRDDPFSFWTSIGPVAVAALLLIVGGLAGLRWGSN